MQLNDRQRRLLWEMTTMIDRDTLNDNLERVGVSMTTSDELIELATELDRGDVFGREWTMLSDREEGERARAAERASEEYWDNKP